MLMRFASYRVRPDADMDAFRAFEARVGEEYAADCLTFGFHSLGTYEYVGAAAHVGTCTHVDVYVVAGDDPEAAEQRGDDAPDPEGFAEIVDECRSFMAPDQRYVHWFVGTGGNPTEDLALGPRAIQVHLGAAAPTTDSGATDLGTFSVASIDGITVASMALTDPTIPGPADGWTLRPVVMGAARFPGLA
jgi:hypothetical protein